MINLDNSESPNLKVYKPFKLFMDVGLRSVWIKSNYNLDTESFNQNIKNILDTLKMQINKSIYYYDGTLK